MFHVKHSVLFIKQNIFITTYEITFFSMSRSYEKYHIKKSQCLIEFSFYNTTNNGVIIKKNKNNGSPDEVNSEKCFKYFKTQIQV